MKIKGGISGLLIIMLFLMACAENNNAGKPLNDLQDVSKEITKENSALVESKEEEEEPSEEVVSKMPIVVEEKKKETEEAEVEEEDQEEEEVKEGSSFALGPEAEDSSGYFMLPESDTKVIPTDVLRRLNKSELRIARNEIYARHGRLFKKEDLKRYFEGMEWYRVLEKKEEIPEEDLNSYEVENINRIKKYEK